MNVSRSRHFSEFDDEIRQMKQKKVLQARTLRFILTSLKWHEERIQRFEKRLKNKYTVKR